MYTRLLPLLFAAAISNAAPAINGIFNAATWAPSGMTNGDIAQGSIFIVTGSGIGPAALQQVSSYPLPTTQGIGGTSIQVTIGSQGFDCIMVYASDNQVAAILPSRTAIGSGTLALLYQGQRTTFPIKVVAASFGLFTVNQRGSGPGVVTSASYQYVTPVNPAHPGDTLIGWGTGLGGATGDETLPPAQVDLKTGVEVWVGNKPATVVYGGRGSSPGLDQVNFMVPAGVTGCYVSVVLKVRAVISNFTSIPIAPLGQSVCSDTVGGLGSGAQIFQSSGTLRTGGISFQRIPFSQDQASGSFGKYDFTNLISARGFGGAPSLGNCQVIEQASDHGPDFTDFSAPPGIDAGSQLTLTGPRGSRSISATSRGAYNAQLGGGNSGSPGFLDPGSYTVSNGSGGGDVKGFSVNFTMPNPLNWTNMTSSTIAPRDRDLLLTWSGTGANDVVGILGVTQVNSNSSNVPYLIFICVERASAGQFSLPSQVLSLIPNGANISGISGMLLAIGDGTVTSFTAPGIDQGYVFAANYAAAVVSLQ
jgi:uncharacterized protein (TIGR03437 family)